MLQEEKINDLLVKHYSNNNKLILQNETNIKYGIAIDKIPCQYTYVETDEDIPEPITNEDAEEEIKAEEERKKKEQEEEEKKAEEERLKELEDENKYKQLAVADLMDGRIALSKLNLKIWLDFHPYSFIKSNGTSDIYSVTEEKQQLLALEIMTDQMLISAGQPCQPTWNAVNKPCESWEFNELQRLAMEIREYIKPRVSTQQHVESQIRECTTEDEIMAIDVGVEIYD